LIFFRMKVEDFCAFPSQASTQAARVLSKPFA
jgi:hypothetical protein